MPASEATPRICARRDVVGALLLFTLHFTARAGNIEVEIKESGGTPVADAVVCATPLSGGTSALKGKAIVAQKNKQFVPYVTAIQKGTAVQFPNQDDVKHHIYSFSPAKKFELPLYAGTPAEPVVFDKAGLVTLGCNIHDWMIGYILVVETPWFAVTTGNGRAQLRGLPAGTYQVEVWQPRLKGPSARTAQRVAVSADNSPGTVSFRVDLKPDFRLRRGPTGTEEGYR